MPVFYQQFLSLDHDAANYCELLRIVPTLRNAAVSSSPLPPPQAQESLLSAPWPPSLLGHELCRPVTAGDVTGNAAAAGKGAAVLSGLRVRMGVNTGLPEVAGGGLPASRDALT